MKVKKIGAVGDMAALIVVPDSELDRTIDHLYKLSHVDGDFTPEQRADAKRMYEGIRATMSAYAGKQNGLNVQLHVLAIAITQVLEKLNG